jgi:hypothetical protein
MSMGIAAAAELVAIGAAVFIVSGVYSVDDKRKRFQVLVMPPGRDAGSAIGMRSLDAVAAALQACRFSAAVILPPCGIGSRRNGVAGR